MDIRVGYRIEIVTNQPTPALLLLDPHPSRDVDIVTVPTPQVIAIGDGRDVPGARVYGRLRQQVS